MMKVNTGRGNSLIRGLAIAAMAGVTAKALTDLIPPRHLPADAPTLAFSAERAAAHLPVLAGEPHPGGSPACRTVADYLVKTLTELGLEANPVAEKVSHIQPEMTALLGRAYNVYTRIPGYASTGQILLVAHYDSAWSSSGASDNAASVCALLEIARILCSEVRRNDIGILFTDMEENGCLGARGFIRNGDVSPENTLVINLEYRGVAGPAIMFEASEDCSVMLREYARASRPVTTSLSSTIYSMLMAGTDLTEFFKAGYRGLNFAAIFGSAYYHTSRDTTENVNLATLQHQGSSVLEVVRGLQEQDLSALPRKRPQIYFTALGRLIRYPEGISIPVAAVAVGGYLAGVARMQSNGLRFPGAAAAALAMPATMAISWGIGKGAWKALAWRRPGYQAHVTGDVYRGAAYRAGLTMVASSAAAAVSSLVRRWVSDDEYITGTWAWSAIAAGLTSCRLPGGSYLFALPLIGGGLALNAALSTGQPDGRLRAASWGYGMVALPLWAPVIALMYPALGLRQAALPLAGVGHLTPFVAPLIAGLNSTREPGVHPWLFGLIGGAALIGAGVVLDRFDHRHPQQMSLAYVQDCDARVARWVSADPVPNPVISRFVGPERFQLEQLIPDIYRGPSPHYRAGMGEVYSIDEPELRVVHAADKDDGRVLELKLVAPADILSIEMYADIETGDFAEVTVDGWPVTPQPNRTWSDTQWNWGFAFYGMPDQGVGIRCFMRRMSPVKFRVVMFRRGLPEASGLDISQEGFAWAAVLSNVTVAIKSYEL